MLHLNLHCGGVDRAVGYDLVGVVFEKVVSCYESYHAKKGTIAQRLAVQHWFDVNFMCQLFNTSKDDQEVWHLLGEFSRIKQQGFVFILDN